MTWFELATALLRGAHLAASLSLLGALVFRQFVVPASEPAWRAAVTRIGLIGGGLAAVFGVAWLAAVAATMAHASTPGTVITAVHVVARHTSFGNLVCLRLLLLVCCLALLSWRHPLAEAGAILAAAAALAVQPFLGHIGALQGGARTVMIPVEIAHLLAAGSWFGGLFPLLFCAVHAPPKLAACLCERFTPIGLVAVGTIAVTALPQAGELIGGLPALVGTQYGHMALIKLGLFALALGLACVNRLVLTTRLVSVGAGPARTGLIVSVAIEFVAVLCVILAAAAMASSVPAEHVQSVWPFQWRPGLEAWSEPELRRELVRLLAAAAAGLTMIGLSQALRRLRIFAAAVAVMVIAPFTPALSLLLVEAYPTSYARSTTGFSVTSIVRGQELFGERCAVCHDAQNGSGGAADLTAPHIWGHLDGELFWWVTNGVQDAEGAALMPGFGTVLSEDDRWALIDFIHARNVGVQVSKTGRWSPPIAAPATPLICGGRQADALAGLAPHAVLIVADPGETGELPSVSADVVPVRLGRGPSGEPGAGECVTASAAAWDAWAVVAGVAPDGFSGYQAVVDGQGWLRAWLPPGAGAERIQAAVRDARDHPVAAGARPDTGHHH
jgi:putative copper export protein/mono/diheme cytochrome c family protein